MDIGKLTADMVLSQFGKPDVIWMPPDCTSYFVAAIYYHRKVDETTGSLTPVTEYARFCDAVNQHCIDLINELDPKFWFIENPMGGLRSMAWMQGLPRYTVTYCQYGDTRQKPTDIWTNHPFPAFKPRCSPSAPCHEPAPRGSKTGTQGLKNAEERAIIPQKLCEHIVDICEKYYDRILPHQTIKQYVTVAKPNRRLF